MGEITKKLLEDVLGWEIQLISPFFSKTKTVKMRRYVSMTVTKNIDPIINFSHMLLSLMDS